MCCFVSLFLLIGPRFALVCMWLFSDMVSRAFIEYLGQALPTLLLILIIVGIVGAVGFAIAAVISGFIQKVRR